MAERECVEDWFFLRVNTQFVGQRIVVEASHCAGSDPERGSHKQDILRDMTGIQQQHAITPLAVFPQREPPTPGQHDHCRSSQLSLACQDQGAYLFRQGPR